MHGTHRVRIALALLALLAWGERALALTLDARVDRSQVEVGGRIALTLTIEGGQGDPDIDLGSTAGFQVYSSGTSQNISILNGRVSASITCTYLLTPDTEGEFDLGPFRAKLGGETAGAPAIRIRVAKGTAPAPERAPEPATRERSERGKSKDVFIETELDKKEAYVGEALTLTFRLYTRVRFAGDPDYQPPSTEGFWKEDLPPQQRYYADVGKTRYVVTELKTALFPTHPGRLVVGPASLAYEEDTFFSSDPFELLRGGGGRRRPVRETLRTDSIAVRVRPLPEAGRPAGFAGAVGSFTLRSSIDKTEVAANEAVTLALTLEGEGNVQAATLPEPRAPESFKVYDSGSSTETSKEGYCVRGKKTYTRVLVPRYGGTYEIAPVSFSFFDPGRGEYVTRTAGPFSIRVEGSAPEDEVSQKDIARLEEDIRYLKEPTSVRWSRATAGFPLSTLAALNALPLVAIGVLLIARKRRERYERDPAWARAKRAGREAREALAEARRLAVGGDAREFAATLARAAERLLSGKGNLAAAGMTRRALDQELARRGIEEETRDRLGRFLESCDRGRFAEGEMPREARESLLREAEDLFAVLAHEMGRTS
jgi:hypothetical protein